MSLYGTGGGGAWAVLKGPGLEKCPKCGYDLRGLMQGVRCPECGTDTARHEAIAPRVGRESPLGAAPKAYLALVLMGFLFCAIGVIGREVWTLLGVLGSDATPRQAAGHAVVAAGMLALWWIGGVLLSRVRPIGTMSGAEWNRKREWATLRWMVRGSIVTGAVSIGSAGVYMAGGPSITILVWGLSEAFTVAAVCWYAARVADWAPDDGLAWRLRTVAWVIGAGAVGYGFALSPEWGLPLVTRMFLGIFMIMMVIGSLLGTLAMLQGANMVRWAIRNMDELRAREDRVAAKAERERIRGEAERATMEAVSAERLRLMDEVEAKHRAMQKAFGEPEVPMPGHAQVIERGSGDTYGIEGEGEPRRGL